MKKIILCIVVSLFAGVHANAEDAVSRAINESGIQIFEKAKTTDGNFILSPFSIHSALSMTMTGTGGVTQKEMEKFLGLASKDALQLYPDFSKRLEFIQDDSAKLAALKKNMGSSVDTIQFISANRLFGEKTFHFKENFLNGIKSSFDGELEPVDFKNDPQSQVKRINSWIDSTTNGKIKDVVSDLKSNTRLILVNTLYFKAPWITEFKGTATKTEKFHEPDGKDLDVQMMHATETYGYLENNGAQIVTLPYSSTSGDEVHFVVILPPKTQTAASISGSDLHALLDTSRNPPKQKIKLSLPKFKIEGERIFLRDTLVSLGVSTAFDIPEKSADFSNMADPAPHEYLRISDVAHKAFVEIDEKGTEAAAATAITMVGARAILADPKPVPEVIVDRPFIFAIQDSKTGVLYFLGQILRPNTPEAL